MSRIACTQITSSATINALIDIQQRFVDQWNRAEMDDGKGQTHDLPGGAQYSASSATGSLSGRHCSFVLPGGVWVTFRMKSPWWHWHDGWSYCRHAITSSDQIRSVVVHGPVQRFHEWACAVGVPIAVEAEGGAA